VVAVITTPSAAREPAGLASHRQGLRIPPLSVKWYTESGRGADGAPARLHQTPLALKGGPSAWARHVRPGPFRALDQSQVDIRQLSVPPDNGFDRA
jgi:hypothetical protein